MKKYIPIMIAALTTSGLSFASRTAPLRNHLIRYDYKPGELTQLCNDAMQKASFSLDQTVRLSTDQRSNPNILLEFESAVADLSDATLPLTFMGYVSTDAGVSQEGADCEQRVNQYMVGVYTRKDIYDYLKIMKAENPQQLRLLTEHLKSFEDNGLNLSEDKLAQMRSLKQKLAALESQFSTNLNQDQSVVEFTQSELEGVSPSYVSSLKKTESGNYIVPTKEPDYVKVMENAVQGETRRKMLYAFENRATATNTQLLEEAIQLRQQIAQLMGYSTWADYRVHGRMAKDSATVLNFLNGLKDKLAQRNQQDLAKLLKMKQDTDPTAKEVKAWDIRYFANQLKKRDYSLDNEVIREYFPADVVLSGLFKVYSTLLGVDFIEQTDAPVWAEGVKLFQIQNQKDHQVVGYFYMDFIPRPLKYGHAAAFPLISGRVLKDGNYSEPVASIVANLSAPENGKPSLLSHDEVTTIFHEFGHIMHQTLTRAPYASLSGSNVDQDFVEAPSQMLENWTYSPEILSLASGHYLDHSKKLPPELLQKLVEARDFNQGYYYTRQLLLGLLDMRYHTDSGAVDTTRLYHDLHLQLIGIEPVEGSHFQASFGHLMGGYDAGYYGYLWSEVYAQDMFTQFEAGGLLNTAVGSRYRTYILEPGRMEDAMDLLSAFLGRQPNAEAFYRLLHL